MNRLTRTLLLLSALLVAMTTVACASVSGPELGHPDLGTNITLEDGPCGAELVLRADAGVPVIAPLPALLDQYELVLEGAAAASARVRRRCQAAPPLWVKPEEPPTPPTKEPDGDPEDPDEP